MTKISNQYSLTNILTADLANSRLGINNVSPTVALDVTGAGKFSGVLTLGSTISNGTYAYTLPSATGTLALTSAISGTTNYIPKFTSSSTIGNSTLFDDGNALITSTSSIYVNKANPFVRFKGTTLDAYIINSNDKLYIADYNTATKNIVLDLSTGNVGIGTSSPNGRLDVKGATATTTSLQLDNGGATYGNYIQSYGGGSYDRFSLIGNDILFFGSGPTERMRIASNGNIGIGTSSNLDHKLKVAGIVNSASGASDSVGGGAAYLLDGSATNGSSLTFLQQGVSKFSIWTYTGSVWGERMSITSGGDIMFKDTSGNNVVYFTAANPSLSMSYSVLNRTASSPMYWNSSTGLLGLNTSARRFKKDIVSITAEQTKIALLLNPVEYTRIETNEKEFGFIAEEVRDAGLGCFVPEIDGEALTIDYSKLSVFAIAMIKEQQKAIQELSAKVSLLENK